MKIRIWSCLIVLIWMIGMGNNAKADLTNDLYSILLNEGEKVVNTYGSLIWNEEQLLVQLNNLREAGYMWNKETTERIINECRLVNDKIEIRKVFQFLFEEKLGTYNAWDIEDYSRFDEILVRYELKNQKVYMQEYEAKITKEDACDIAIEYLLNRPDIGSKDLKKENLVNCTIKYKLVKESESLQWVIRFTLDQPVSIWQGFTVRVSADDGAVEKYTPNMIFSDE